MISRALEAEILRLHYSEHWLIGTISTQLRVHHSTVRRVQKVTHHGSLDPAPAGTVTTSSSPCPPAEGTHADLVSLAALPSIVAQRTTPPPLPHRSGSAGCSLCGQALPSFARLGPLRGGP